MKSRPRPEAQPLVFLKIPPRALRRTRVGLLRMTTSESHAPPYCGPATPSWSTTPAEGRSPTPPAWAAPRPAPAPHFARSQHDGAAALKLPTPALASRLSWICASTRPFQEPSHSRSTASGLRLGRAGRSGPAASRAPASPIGPLRRSPVRGGELQSWERANTKPEACVGKAAKNDSQPGSARPSRRDAITRQCGC